MNTLNKTFFNRPPELVAPELIGAYLVVRPAGATERIAQITEVEACLGQGDASSHGVRHGRTPAREALFMGPGTIYIHPMRAYVGLDIVTQEEGVPSSVLIRAAEPLAGFAPDIDMGKHLTGPGKLCRGLSITKAFYGMNISDPDCPLSIMPREGLPEVRQSKRVGISRNQDAKLRFFIK